MTFTIRNLSEASEKQSVVRQVLEALPDWFAIEEGREAYIRESAGQICFGAYSAQQCVGFLCLKQTGNVTAELAVMGVLQPFHRLGIGRKLFEAAKAKARALGFSFIQVKTVQMGMYPDYDATNRFYLSLGFQEFEVLPTLWDEANPCQIYIMAI
ncbi:MAG: GNAT family N-acetyltransferase [Oscillospiraceae bacterium]|nr:GNAT family N-acetyltransferase [Oscillospiraceae bacterium]